MGRAADPNGAGPKGADPNGAGPAGVDGVDGLPDPPAYVAPGTAAERLVAGVWADLLGVDEVGVHDDFFQLGGSSLQLVRLAERLQSASGVAVELVALFTATTVGAQAGLLAPEPAAAGPPRIRPQPRVRQPARPEPEPNAP